MGAPAVAVPGVVKATWMPPVKLENAQGASDQLPDPPLRVLPPEVWRPVSANCQPVL
jgi:hypothetical protein